MGKCVSKADTDSDVEKDKDPDPEKMNKTTRTLYYRAEFTSMGDVLKDGTLDQKEFTRLVKLLGLPEADRAADMLWKRQKKADPGWLSEKEYVSLMMDPEVDAKTNMWRKLFAEFDKNGSGFASREEVAQGLQKMGITVDDKLKAKIVGMDPNKDGQIYYGDFLKTQLLHK